MDSRVDTILGLNVVPTHKIYEPCGTFRKIQYSINSTVALADFTFVSCALNISGQPNYSQRGPLAGCEPELERSKKFSSKTCKHFLSVHSRAE